MAHRFVARPATATELKRTRHGKQPPRPADASSRPFSLPAACATKKPAAASPPMIPFWTPAEGVKDEVQHQQDALLEHQ